MSVQAVCLQMGPCRARRGHAGYASPVTPACRAHYHHVLPARASEAAVRRGNGGKEGYSAFLVISTSGMMQRHSHWCLQRVMRPKYGVWFTSCDARGNISENKELVLGLWSHSLLQQVQLQAAARRDVSTLSPYPWATTDIHLIMKWARSGTNSTANWSNQNISVKFSASLVSWSAMNASVEAQVFSFYSHIVLA